MTTQSTTQRLRSFVEGSAEISREIMHAAQSGSMSPYHYVKPFILRAADVGEPPLASTPHKVVYTNGKMRLLRFEPTVRKHATPILFVYSLINRYYILDFLPGRSLIQYMVARATTSTRSTGARPARPSGGWAGTTSSTCSSRTP